jgi:hypothetical protein
MNEGLSDAEFLGDSAPAATPPPQGLTDEEFLKPAPASWSDAITDIPSEIGRTFAKDWDAIKQGFRPSERGQELPAPQPRAPWEAWKSPVPVISPTTGAGEAVTGAVGAVTSPVTGIVRSTIGHPLAQTIHAAGTLIAPQTAATDNPEEMYQSAANAAETAASLAMPRGTWRTGPFDLPAAPTLPPSTDTSPGKLPFTRAGQETLAGRTLASRADDPTKLLSTLSGEGAPEGAATPVVPGSKPTTFQLTGDMGLGSLEREVATKNPADFNERRAQQNAARLRSLENVQPTGSPEDVTTLLRGNLDRISAEADATHESALAAAQAHADALGGTGTPESYGEAIRGGVDPRVAALRAQAEDAVQGLGGQGTPEAYGQTLRQSLVNAENTARASERGLWNAVDPDGTLTVSMQPIRDAVDSVYGKLSNTAAASIKPAERQLADIVGNYREIEPFQDLKDLRSQVSTALREERSTSGRTPTYARLSQLRGAIENSLDEGLQDYFARQAGEVAAGTRAPEDTAAARLQGVAEPVGPANKPPQSRSLFEALADAGGLQRNGEINGIFGGKNQLVPGKGYLVRGSGQGLSPDAALQVAKDRGYLQDPAEMAGREQSLGHEDLYDLIDREARGDKQYPVGSEIVRAQDRDELEHHLHNLLDDHLQGAGIDPLTTKPQVRARTLELMERERLDASVAYEQAVMENSQHAVEQGRNPQFPADVPGWHVPHDPGAASGPREPTSEPWWANVLGERGPARTSGEANRSALSQARAPRFDYRSAPQPSPLAPNFDPGAAERLRAASAATRERAQTFGAQPLKGILRSEGAQGPYNLPEAAVPAKIFAKGPGGFDTVHRYLNAVGNNPEARAQLADYAISSMRQAAIRPDGTINPSQFATWRRSYSDALRAFPELDQRLSNVARASELAQGVNPFGTASVASLPARYFRQGATGAEGVAELRNLIGDQRALPLLQDYAAHSLRQTALTADGTIDPNKFARWANAHSEAMRAFPQLNTRFADAASATRAIGDAAAARKAAVNAAQQGALGNLIDAHPDDIPRIVGRIFGKSTAAGEMKNLVDTVRHSQPAMEGLRRAVVDHIMARLVSNTEAGTTEQNLIKSDQFQTFMRQAEPALRELFEPGQVDSMKAVAADLQRANRSMTAVKLPGQSNTAQDLLATKGKSYLSKMLPLWIAENAGAAVGGMLGGWPGEFLGSIITTGATALGTATREAGLAKVDDLVKEAMLHPEIARSLLQKATPNSRAAVAGILSRRLVPLSMFSNLPAYQPPQTPREQGRAAGGRTSRRKWQTRAERVKEILERYRS